MDESQHIKNRLGDRLHNSPAAEDEESEIDHLFQAHVQRAERVVFLRACIQLKTNRGRDAGRGHSHPSRHDLLAFVLGYRGRTLFRHQHR